MRSVVSDNYVVMPREASRAMTMAACDYLPSCEHVFGHVGEMLRNAYLKMVEVGSIGPAPAPLDPETAADNAALIAAIPRMISALEFVRDGYARNDVSHEEYRVQVYGVVLDVLASIGRTL
jgi:hypothetical protein